MVFNPRKSFPKVGGIFCLFWCQTAVKKKQVRNLTEENQKWVLTGRKKKNVPHVHWVRRWHLIPVHTWMHSCLSLTVWELAGCSTSFLSNGEMTRRTVSRLELKPCTAMSFCHLIFFAQYFLPCFMFSCFSFLFVLFFGSESLLQGTITQRSTKDPVVVQDCSATVSGIQAEASILFFL